MTDGDDLAGSRAETPSILTKAFDLLRAFNAQERVMTLSQLSRASGLPKSTVHRLIARLMDLGAIEQHRNGYRIGLGLLEISSNTPAGSMRDHAMPFLSALHQWSGLTVRLAVLRQFDVVYLEQLERPSSTRTLSGVGQRLPAHCTAIGKALLAWEDLEDLEAFLPDALSRMTPYSITSPQDLILELRKVRADKIAHDHNETQMGLACLAAPVIVHDFAVAAVSVSFDPDDRVDSQVEMALRDTVARIAAGSRSSLAKGREHWFPRER